MPYINSEYKLKKRDKAPDFSLKATDEKVYTLEEITKDSKLSLLVFICNHCPMVKTKLPELNRIAADYQSKGVTVIGISSNDDTEYPEDSFEKMKEYSREGRVNFLYLHDPTQHVARAYGAVCTPDPFLFDSNLKLLFHSRIVDPAGKGPIIKPELYEAIGEYLEKKTISIPESPSMGCSIKWK